MDSTDVTGRCWLCGMTMRRLEEPVAGFFWSCVICQHYTIDEPTMLLQMRDLQSADETRVIGQAWPGTSSWRSPGSAITIRKDP